MSPVEADQFSRNRPATVGELRASGYRSRGVKEELRENLRGALSRGENPFEGIHGYERTVLPALHNAILSKHDLLLLGLRGQAKTRLLRMPRPRPRDPGWTPPARTPGRDRGPSRSGARRGARARPRGRGARA